MQIRARNLEVNISSALISSFVEPSFYIEATSNEDWKKAMEDEIEQIQKNNTWELMPTPKNKVISIKWIYKLKHNPTRVLQIINPI